MNTRVGYTAVALLATTALAHAGGIERTTQSVAPLFEEGRYLELSFSSVSPSVDGVGFALTNGVSSGDMLESYFQFGAAYKADINNELSYALIFDAPYGADVAYPAGTGYFAAGSTAELRSYALTGLLKYRFPSNFSVYGGVRAQSLEAQTAISFPGLAYTANAERDYGLGFVIGAAYEIPEIAARVSLTYNSEITHELATSEVVNGTPVASTTTVETPDSLNLEFQSGIAEDTLLFGSIRWVDWSEFTLDPLAWNNTIGRPLVSYADDYVTYTLGVGRRLNSQWSIAGTVGYETEINALTTNLGPTDGNWSVGVGATYQVSENMELTGGLRYIDIGNAGTNVGIPNTPGGLFEDNHAVAIGFRMGYSF